MKKYFLTIVMIFAGMLVFSQDLPFARQYMFDQTLLNPAIGSRNDFITIKLTGNQQWTQMPRNPLSQTLSYNMKFINKMGFNAALLNDRYGVINNSGLKLSYFYYTKLNTKGDYISFGASVSGYNYAIKMSQLNPATPDPRLSGDNMNTFFMNAGIGVYYEKDKLSLGLSAGNLVPYKPSFANTDLEPSQSRTYTLYGEYRIKNEINTMAVVPSLLFSIDELRRKEVNINTKLIIQNVVWFGVSYRDAITLQAQAMHKYL